MKHLKYIKESHNHYYERITEDEYDDLVLGKYDETHSNKDTFNKREVDFFNTPMKGILINFWEKIKIVNSTPHFQTTKEFDNSYKIHICSKHDEFSIYITKLVDSYFIFNYLGLNDYSEKYKCDQFEGLIKLLEDKIY